MIYPLSFYFYGRWGSIESWKAVTFKELFGTIPVPYGKNFHDAVRYFEENYIQKDEIILIGNSTLELLCGQYDWGSYFKRYSSVDEAYFQFDIHRFIKNREYPVVVYAATTKWGSGQIKDNILTVWAVSDDEVKVTKVSEAATPLFGDNNIIILTWEELFDKAIETSSNNTANVAFMHSGI